MVRTKFGENPDSFSSFFKSRKQIFSRKSIKSSKIDNKWDAARERRESRSWNFVESCGRRSP